MGDEIEDYSDGDASEADDITQVTPAQSGRFDTAGARRDDASLWGGGTPPSDGPGDEYYYGSPESGRWVVLTIAIMVFLAGLGTALYFLAFGSDESGPSASRERGGASAPPNRVAQLRAYVQRRNALMRQGGRTGNHRPLLRFELAHQFPRMPFALKTCYANFSASRGARFVNVSYPDYSSMRPDPEWEVPEGRYEGVRPSGDVYSFQTVLKRQQPGRPPREIVLVRHVAWFGGEGPYFFKNCTLDE